MQSALSCPLSRLRRCQMPAWAAARCPCLRLLHGSLRAAAAPWHLIPPWTQGRAASVSPPRAARPWAGRSRSANSPAAPPVPPRGSVQPARCVTTRQQAGEVFTALIVTEAGPSQSSASVASARRCIPEIAPCVRGRRVRRTRRAQGRHEDNVGAAPEISRPPQQAQSSSHCVVAARDGRWRLKLSEQRRYLPSRTRPSVLDVSNH